MINTLKTGNGQGHDAQRGEVLERIQKEYGRPEDKQRDPVKKLGKDEFFKIMVTQIQHQDPLKPYQNEQMAAQMAQFTALEQTINVNNNLEKLINAQQPLQNLGAASLIGKHVTADSSRVLHTEGHYTDVQFELPVDAKRVRAIIINERGENVREIEVEDLKKGTAKIQWDGRKSNNMPATSGQYLVQISAVTENDKPIQVQTQKTDVVHGVAFEGKEPVLLVGDMRHPQKLLLKNVYKIVEPHQMPLAPAGNQNEAQNQNQGDGDLVPGMDVGVASKYLPMNAAAFNQAQQKPDIVQAPSQEDIKRLLAEGPDLSGANPVGAALREGKQLESAPNPGAKRDEMEGINPAARERGFKAGMSSEPALAGGQPLPSGEEGSVAGKLAE